MQIKVVSLIRGQDDNLKDAQSDYVRRISRWLPCEVIEIKRDKITEGDTEPSLSRKETRKIDDVVKDGVIVVLDRQGKRWSSKGLSQWLEERMMAADKALVFILGGPLGLPQELMDRARFKISLSELTFPHKLARLLVLEALYRSLSIIHKTPYHK